MAPHERLWLTIRGIGPCRVVLNDAPLAEQIGPAGAEFDVSEHVRQRNQLVIELPRWDADVWQRADVALEVRCLAFLRDTRITPADQAGQALLRATGLVVGPADLPLDLYLLRGRRTMAHATASATPAGTAFALAGDGPDDSGGDSQATAGETAAVELVHGAVLWYRHEGMVSAG